MTVTSLREWQNALAAQVVRASSATSRSSGVDDSAGLAITKRIQRDWRRFRLHVGAPLTLAVLGPAKSAVIENFQLAEPWPSSFFGTEAVAFVEHALQVAGQLPHLASVARFERAMLLLSAYAAFLPAQPAPSLASQQHAEGPYVPHPAADVVEFAEPPERVLAALLRGEPPPPPGRSKHWLLLAPMLPHLCRRATTAEAQLFMRYSSTAPYRRGTRYRRHIDAADPVEVEALTGLLTAGALVPRPAIRAQAEYETE